MLNVNLQYDKTNVSLKYHEKLLYLCEQYPQNKADNTLLIFLCHTLYFTKAVSDSFLVYKILYSKVILRNASKIISHIHFKYIQYK